MPLNNNVQPQIVYLSDEIRLVAYDGDYSDALIWYRDPFIYHNSEGITDRDKIPDETYIQKMYHYLNLNSELYFIEGLEDSHFVRIGDVAIKPTNPPIVIANPNFRGKGYSKLVMRYVIDRLRILGYKQIENTTVYKHNEISLKMHISLGYEIVSQSDSEYLLNYDLRVNDK